MIGKTRIVALLPAFNEEIAIGSMVLRIRKHVDRVLVIDDGSTDRTAEVARLAGAEVICHPTNKGKGAALKTGFEAATKNARVLRTLSIDSTPTPTIAPTTANIPQNTITTLLRRILDLLKFWS